MDLSAFSLNNWQKRNTLKDARGIYSMNMDINVNSLILRIHPVYDQYAASRCGKVVNIDSEAILLGTPSTSCNISNMRCSVSSPDETPRRELKIRRAAEYF